MNRATAQLYGLGGGALVLWLGMTYWAYSGWGIFAGIGFGLFALIGVGLPWLYVRVLLTPFGKGLFGTGFLILAQLTFGAGALVRLDNGSYEWGRLREDNDGLYTKLSSGKIVRIDGERSDLPSVAWAPLAIVEEKTDRNMNRITVDQSSFKTERPDPASTEGESVKTPLRIADGGEKDDWHIDSSKLERWVHDAAGAELPRSGVRKALEEKGGEQHLSQFWLAIISGGLVVTGFVLGYGAIIL